MPERKGAAPLKGQAGYLRRTATGETVFERDDEDPLDGAKTIMRWGLVAGFFWAIVTSPFWIPWLEHQF